MKTREVRFSKNVEAAANAVNSARDDLVRALRRAYPLGEPVRVIHHRGEYTGIVMGHDAHGARVVIENDATGKTSRRYFREVEMEAE